MIHFDKFFCRKYLHKMLIQILEIVVVLKNFYKFVLIHETYLFLVRKNTHEEIICLS